MCLAGVQLSSSSGSITSATSYGGSGNDRAEGLTISSNSYVSVCGTYQGSLTMAGSTVTNAYGTLTPYAATLQVGGWVMEEPALPLSTRAVKRPRCQPASELLLMPCVVYAWMAQVGSAPTRAASKVPSGTAGKSPTRSLLASSLAFIQSLVRAVLPAETRKKVS